MDWIAAHFAEIVPHYSLEMNITGSLGGLIALAEGQAEIAGCHLWDEETDNYNLPFIRRLLPGHPGPAPRQPGPLQSPHQVLVIPDHLVLLWLRVGFTMTA